MIIENILQPERTQCNVSASSKKRIMETLADLLHDSLDAVDSEVLFESFIAREKLGSTGIGKGIAIPHCRCNKIDQTVGCLIKLQEPVDFDAHDNLPVDLIFALLVPEDANDEHLQVLAELAKTLDHTEFRNKLRKSQTDEELYQVATSEKVRAA